MLTSTQTDVGPLEENPEYKLIVEANNLVLDIDNELSECTTHTHTHAQHATGPCACVSCGSCERTELGTLVEITRVIIINSAHSETAQWLCVEELKLLIMTGSPYLPCHNHSLVYAQLAQQCNSCCHGAERSFTHTIYHDFVHTIYRLLYSLCGVGF